METIDAFRRADPRILDDDPFWSRVRRRHPDVDVVLVPSDGPGDDPPEEATATPGEIGSMLATVGELWRSVVRPILAEAGATAPPSIRWRRRPDGGTAIVQKALPGVGQEAGTDLLRALFHALHDRGWSVGPGIGPGTSLELPALRATDGTLVLDAAAGPGATVITLAGPPTSLGTDPALAALDELRLGVA